MIPNKQSWAMALIVLAALAAGVYGAAGGERVYKIAFTVSTAAQAPGTYVESTTTTLPVNVWKITEADVSFAGSATGISVLLCDRASATTAIHCQRAVTVDSAGEPVTQTAQHHNYRFWPPILYRPALVGRSMTIKVATFGDDNAGQTVTLYAEPQADY